MSNIEPIESPLPYSRGNVIPILNEVVHAIDRLMEDDEPTVIDLASLPFAPGELEQLEDFLGVGELTAELDALGKSRIRESMYPGVWWLEHRNTADEVVGRYIEITRTPEILMSQDADIGAGRARLRLDLDEMQPDKQNGTGDASPTKNQQETGK
jgi:hydrogenase-1 operon protein HyaF